MSRRDVSWAEGRCWSGYGEPSRKPEDETEILFSRAVGLKITGEEQRSEWLSLATYLGKSETEASVCSSSTAERAAAMQNNRLQTEESQTQYQTSVVTPPKEVAVQE